MSVIPWSTKGSKSTIDITNEVMLFVPSEALPADKNKTITGADNQVYTENITLHAGIRRGLVLSVASGTTFDVAEGEAIIVDKDHNRLLTTVTRITKAAESGITDTNHGVSISNIFMDAAATITVETMAPQMNTDICDKSLNKLFEFHQFDVFNHHAAQMDVIKSVADTTFDENTTIIVTIYLLQNAVKTEFKKFIFLSSDVAVYCEQE